MITNKKEWLQSLRDQPEKVAYGLTVVPVLGWFLIVCLLWLLIGCAQPVPSYPRDQVRVVMVSTGGNGSGVVIRPGLILTAKHVAVVPGLVLVKDGTKGTGVVMAEQEEVDLALIRYPLAEASCPCVRLADSEAAIDEPVFVIGYPLGIAQMVTMGHAQSIQEVYITDDWGQTHKLGKRLVLTAGVMPGNSGGGVFVFRDGEYQLVGIMVQMMPMPGGPISFAVPLAEIKDFLAGRT
jgi:S1-C subfamily serine protease